MNDTVDRPPGWRVHADALRVVPGFSAPARLAVSTDALRRERVRLSCIADLSLFVRWAWPILNPGTALVWGRHIDVVCAQLQAITEGRAAKVTVVNVPPGHSKTTVISVCWPVWEWLRHPHHRWLFAAHSLTNTIRDNDARRDLVTSGAFQTLFHPWATPPPFDSTVAPRFRRIRWRLSRGKVVKSRFVNSSRGSMRATAVGAKVTGDHADRLVIDDPLDAGDLRGPALAGHVRWYDEKLRSRVRDGAAIVLVMQRLHEDDLAGVLIRRATERGTLATPGGLDLLIFPEHYSPNGLQCATVTGLGDWRTERGQLLYPERFSEEVIAVETADLLPYARSAQREQDPTMEEGAFFDPSWWPRYTTPPLGGRLYVSVDPTSWSERTAADVCAIHLYQLAAGRLYLREVWSGQHSLPEAADVLDKLREAHPLVFQWLVEDKAGGRGLIQTMKSRGWVPTTIVPINPQRYGNKLARADSAAPMVMHKRVSVPVGKVGDDFIEQCRAFPFGRIDDDVDALTQAIMHEPINRALGGGASGGFPSMGRIKRAEVGR